MAFERTQKALTFALALISAIPLVASTEIGLYFTGAFFVLFGVGWFAEYRWMRSTRYRRVVTAVVLALMGIQLIRLAMGLPMAQLGMEFIAVVMGIKLVSRGYAADYYQIVILAFLHIIAATVAISALIYGICFVLFVGLSSPVLALSYLRQEMESRFSPNLEGQESEVLDRLFLSKRIVSPGFILGSALLSIPILFLTAVLFVIFPRLGLGVFGRLQDTEAEVGFGDTVALGDLDIVRMESTVLLRLEPIGIDESLPDALDMRIRGAVFDSFENNVWTKKSGKGWRHLPVMGHEYRLDKDKSATIERSFQVLLEPMTPKLLFIPEGTGKIRTDLVLSTRDVAPRRLETNDFGEVRYLDDAEVGIRYRVDITGASPVGAPPDREVTYLQLPSDSDRLVELAGELAADGSARSIASQLVASLKTRYRYSISLSENDKNLDEETPLDRFLFSRKTGTCEHFATALTLMLRARGIPARLVTGFLGADLNSIGGFYSVRKRSAHSWTEAFIDGRWVSLDATPPALEPGQRSLSSFASMALDTLRMRWHKHVIGYDSNSQAELAIALWRYWRRGRTSRVADVPRIPRAIPIALVALLIGGFAIYRLWRRSSAPLPRRASEMRRSSQKEAIKLFSMMEKKLDRLGYPRPASRTPVEHAETLRADAPTLASSTREIVDRYNEVRFGTSVFEDGELFSLATKIRRLGVEEKR